MELRFENHTLAFLAVTTVKSLIEAHQNSTKNQTCNWSCMSMLNEHAVLDSSCGLFNSFWWSGADLAPGHLKLLDWHICAAFWCAFIRDLIVIEPLVNVSCFPYNNVANKPFVPYKSQYMYMFIIYFVCIKTIAWCYSFQRRDGHRNFNHCEWSRFFTPSFYCVHLHLVGVYLRLTDACFDQY